jgi:hypothetical protein
VTSNCNWVFEEQISRKKLTNNSIEQSPSWETDIRSASQEVPATKLYHKPVESSLTLHGNIILPFISGSQPGVHMLCRWGPRVEYILLF